MESPKIHIKFKRSIKERYLPYNDEVEKCLRRLIGDDAKEYTSGGFICADLLSKGGYLERHEDGPELIITAIEQLPAYVSVIAALVAIWMNRKKQKPEATFFEIETKDSLHRFPLETKDDEKLAKQIIHRYTPDPKKDTKPRE